MHSLKVCVAILLVSLLLPAFSTAATLARVTDLVGSATMQSDGKSKPLRILSRIRNPGVIELTEGSTITLHFLSSGTDYQFTGEDRIKVETDLAASESGNQPQVAQHEQTVNANVKELDLGAMVVRGGENGNNFKLLHPKRSKILPQGDREFA